MPATKAPYIDPKYSAEKNPGQESKATVEIGLGGWIKEPMTLKAEKRATLAIPKLFIILRARQCSRITYKFVAGLSIQTCLQSLFQ